MRSAEGRQEIVERSDVRRIHDFERCSVANVPFGMEEVVHSNTQVDHIPRLHTIRIVVIVFLAWKIAVAALRKGEQFESTS